MTFAIAAAITVGLLIYVVAGRAYWLLLNLNLAQTSPAEYAACPINQGLRTGGDWRAFLLYCVFIAFWPAWLALGWFLVKLQIWRAHHEL